MPLKNFSSNKWPKHYGFDIVGEGPCFVAYVVHGSVAYNAGLKPGDQVIEIDGQDVSSLSLETLKKLAKNSPTQPPPVGVVARYHQVDLVGSRTSGYGFKVSGDKPVTVESVEVESPAFQAGLKPGDIILEVNGQTVKKAEEMKNILSGKLRRMTLSLVPIRNISATKQTEITSRGTRGDISLERRESGRSERSDKSERSNRSNSTLRSNRPSTSGRSEKISIPDNGMLSHSTPITGRSRITQARILHKKMNDILGDDFEKKMATVSVLKQYAEDRDIDMLGRALKAILKTPQQKKIMKQIRPFIPPRQRHRFDDFVRENNVTSLNDDQTSNGGQKNEIKISATIYRDNGSYGFVLAGNNPVYVESVEPGGSADRAGLQGGDNIIKVNKIDVRGYSHANLVQLLQNSDTAPQVDILRTCNDNSSVRLNGSMCTRTSSSLSVASSATSHASSDWQGPDVKKDGKTFKQSAYYLLTTKERSQLKKAMLEYDSRKNVVDLFKRLSQILDTHSKKSLWKYILPILPSEHMDYCVSKGGLPRSIIQDMKIKGGGKRSHDKSSTCSYDSRHNTWSSKASSSTLVNHDTDFSSPPTPTNGPHISSFKKQMEYLLTSRERMQLKKALQIYTRNRKIDNLILDLNVILDTPSKQTLWNYIVQFLSSAHQEYARRKLNLSPSSKASDQSSVHFTDFLSSTEVSPRLPRKNTFLDNTNGYRLSSAKKIDDWRRSYENLSSSEDDIQHRTLKSGVRRSRGRLWKTMHPGYMYSYDDMDARDSNKVFDIALLKELEQTRRAVQEAKRMFLGANKGDNPDSDDPDSDDPSNKYVTVIPVGFGEMESKDRSPTGSHRLKSSLKNSIPFHKQNGGPPRLLTGLHNPPDIVITESESDIDSDLDNTRSNFSMVSGDSFNQRALTALKELDAVMAAEVSDIDVGSSGQGTKQKPPSPKNSPKMKHKTISFTEEVMVHAPPAPPPPPPPPLPPPSSSDENSESLGKMNVKRINWEKIDVEKVGNTIWEQIGDEEDLDDVLRYLELEQHFSTSPGKISSRNQRRHSVFVEKRNEVYILSPKKAYNISILLGHLRMSIDQMKQALYLMDEEILTPELLKQLLAYTPNKQEMEKYDGYNGDIEDLSLPDKFAFEMSRVPGYEQRLKSILFKANFHEKIDEMRENLLCIRKSALQLKHSRKLAKILEMILAMGNYMNKGNQRVGEAAGFKISFISQLEITKTSDNKTTFLHVLANAVYVKFPDVLAVGEELSSIPESSKVSDVMVNQEIQELRKVLQEISNTLEKYGSQKNRIGINDRFQDVMGHFISQASDEVQTLFRLQANAMEDFHNVVQYFGEDPKNISTTEFFGIFADFIIKFEKAHRYNMMYKRH